jgi:hypothetical protein
LNDWRVAEATPDGRYQALLAYTGYLNQGFAKVSVVASGVALVLWGCAIWRTRRLHRTTAVVGLAGGTILALGILTGYLRLNVRGIVIATFLQAVWMTLVAMHFLRAPSLDGGANAARAV